MDERRGDQMSVLPELTTEEVERYARHIVLRDIGGPGQRKLKAAKVCVIGAGGLGAPLLLYLAAAGVGELTIIDDDVVSLSNLQRQILFGAADSTAAAVAYAAAKITQLTSFGDIAAAERNTTSELQALRRAVERDRYGLMAYVLAARDHCTASACAAFRSLGDSRQIASNMDERLYENLVTRHASSWNAPAQTQTAAGLSTGLPPSVPTGKPTNAEFPTSASTPPVNIMTPEPGSAPAAKPPAAPKPQTAATAPPSSRPAPAASPAPAAAKKQTAAKRPAAAPVPLAPAAQPPAASSEPPPASND